MTYSGLVTRRIWCCTCERSVVSRLTTGAFIYPHRPDLKDLPFWICPECSSYVGCHYKTDQPYRPLGFLSSGELKWARRRIHDLLDPLWKSGLMKRTEVYEKMSRELGYQYHSAEIRTMSEARRILNLAQQLHSTRGERTT